MGIDSPEFDIIHDPLPPIKLIKSDETRVRYLHRTSADESKIESIMEEGFVVGPGSLNSTATACPLKIEDAVRIYRKRQGEDSQIFILEFLREVHDDAYHKSKLGEIDDVVDDPIIALFDSDVGYVIRPWNVRGVIDRETGRFTHNRHFGQPQANWKFKKGKHFAETRKAR